LPFALTSIAFTGLFLLVWRLLFVIWRTMAQRHSVQNGKTESITV